MFCILKVFVHLYVKEINNYCIILDVNKFKKEDNEDGPINKNGTCKATGMIIFTL